MKTAIISLVLITGLITCKQKNMELTQKEKAVAFIKSFETGSSDVLSFLDENIKSHNYGLPDGKSTYEGYFTDTPSGATVEFIRVLEDKDFVIMHNRYENLYGYDGPMLTFDIVRFKDGKIAEHWDNIIAIQALNPSNRTQTDGTLKISDIDKTEANKELIHDFITTVLVNTEQDKMKNYFDGDNLIQHNPTIGDGTSNFTKALEIKNEKTSEIVYAKNHKVVGQGNFVLAISEGTLSGEPTSFYDLFRVENGKIAEHWDVIETITPASKWQNTNEKFNF
ncbi:nuclear transport factor 2 family protein [Marinifilum sp. RC60d5]|uniref:nuclear transport factor 2 family protein n=1 Tax=Marinifilum sp. RC60d5 TaxID=3458414 RepID=UPI0040354151